MECKHQFVRRFDLNKTDTEGRVHEYSYCPYCRTIRHEIYVDSALVDMTDTSRTGMLTVYDLDD